MDHLNTPNQTIGSTEKYTYFVEIDLSLSISGHALAISVNDCDLGNHVKQLPNAQLDLNNVADRPSIAIELDNLFLTSGSTVTSLPSTQHIVRIHIPDVPKCTSLNTIFSFGEVGEPLEFFTCMGISKTKMSD